MASMLKLNPYHISKVYDQWEWQQSPKIWRRYPCTISHKLNSIFEGETIYVTIYEWVYIITKHTSISGTQTNLFTQTTRKMRVIAPSSDVNHEQKEEETQTQNKDTSVTSLYYNYSYANIVLISTLKDNEARVKKLFYSSLSETDYEITLLTQVQLSQNNKQYQNYRAHLKMYCNKHHKRKDELEALLWSNCSITNKQYAHSNNVCDIIQKQDSNNKHHYLVYLCRAIYILPDNDDNNANNALLGPKSIDSQHVMDQIPLYLLNFRSIDFDSFIHAVDEDASVMVAQSLFVNDNHNVSLSSSDNTHSLHSYSQPLLSLKNTISPKRLRNNYGTNKEEYDPSDFDKTWVELMQQEDAAYFASTFDVNHIIDKLLSVRHKTPGTKVHIKRSDIENICIYAKTLLMQQPVFLELESPINVVGDIHGQYFDLLRLFDHGSYPPQSNYLFLGDYVDRGGQSLECVCLLLCYKIKYEENFFLLRGNHENGSINRIYGFYDECKRRYSVRVWRKFVDVFNHLPVAATICDKIFCVHGGLSPQLFINDNVGNMQRSASCFDNNIKKIQRPTQVGDYGLVCDLLWSDPSFDLDGWNDNQDRGVSYYFGRDIVNSFNKNFEMDLICRAHQVVEDGYEFFNKRQLVTIFSAPNYCGEFDNCAAFMQVDQYLKCSFVTLDPQKGYRSQIVKRNF